jgi:uncharacterized membrane protein
MRYLLTVATLLFVALSMGMAQAHALELPPKMEYDASMYLRLHRTLYRLFGPPLGAGIEALAVLLSIILAVIVRNEPGSAWLAAGGAAAMVIAHVIWWIWVNPANRALAQMPLASPPPDWTERRNQWEYTHLARFFLQLIAFAALLLSFLQRGST